MKLLLVIFIPLFLSNTVKAEKLTVYTYDSFISEWGPGPIIEEIFEDKYNTDLEFIAVDGAATLLNKIILEGENSKADIVLGLDMNLFDAANKSNLFTKHSLENINKDIQVPVKWNTDIFVPYNYGYFSFVYNNEKLTTPPRSMDELINVTDAKIVIQDPRTSTVGLGLLTWMKSIYGDDSQKEWTKLNKKIISVTKGWTDAYYNFFMAGEADIVLSYSTSPAAHIMFEDRNDISATTFSEGNYISVEFAGILKSSKNKKMAKNFLNFMVSDDFQSVIPSTNIMYPVKSSTVLPDAFNKLKIPEALQIDPEEINNNKEKWIDEWLNAS